MLSSLIRLHPSSLKPAKDETEEDIFSSSLGALFTDDQVNQHGGPGSRVMYRSSRFGDIELQLPEPVKEEERGLFAHYVWNAGVLLAELIGRGKGGFRGEVEVELGVNGEIKAGARERNAAEKVTGVERGSVAEASREKLQRDFEEYSWSVKGERVLELGAGPGSGLVSLSCALAGAEWVTSTDHPTLSILSTIQSNIVANLTPARLASLSLPDPPPIQVLGHLWGTEELVEPHMLNRETMVAFSAPSPQYLSAKLGYVHGWSYTRVVSADTLWMAREHVNLLKSIDLFLADGGRAWIVAGFHTGRAKVVGFFEEVEAYEGRDEGGFEVERRWEVDVDGEVRAWDGERVEGVVERKRWCVVAVLKRRERRIA